MRHIRLPRERRPLLLERTPPASGVPHARHAARQHHGGRFAMDAAFASIARMLRKWYAQPSEWVPRMANRTAALAAHAILTTCAAAAAASAAAATRAAPTAAPLTSTPDSIPTARLPSAFASAALPVTAAAE